MKSCGQRTQSAVGNNWETSGRQVRNHGDQSTKRQTIRPDHAPLSKGLEPLTGKTAWGKSISLTDYQNQHNYITDQQTNIIMRAEHPGSTGRQVGDKRRQVGDKCKIGDKQRQVGDTCGRIPLKGTGRQGDNPERTQRQVGDKRKQAHM